MTTRLLPAAEYDRLAGTELESVLSSLPERARVMVVEDDGAIVATWALLPCWHMEGLWVAPTHRGRPSVGRRLLAAMWTAARSVGTRTVWTSAVTEDVAAMVRKLHGQRVPGDHFVISIGG